ncbi:hypothetical protein B0I35DRAFT_426482 [Stachybotrys elegans]|uniref:Uncharacterized protein n=1 Tax=Stachybotrys elegans TaxID=80388 RepID=A0A8K0SVS4_9HYPO|nr:hypothetical protein B0I35DRAFT_426482 [Stachybotrys elegans]
MPAVREIFHPAPARQATGLARRILACLPRTLHDSSQGSQLTRMCLPCREEWPAISRYQPVRPGLTGRYSSFRDLGTQRPRHGAEPWPSSLSCVGRCGNPNYILILVMA